MFNRDLRLEIATLKDRLVANSEELERYRKKFAAAENDLREATASRHEAEQKIQKLQKEVKETKKLVRKQTEADLLINSLIAVGIIKDESPKQPDRFERAIGLQQQLAALQPSPYTQRGAYNTQSIFGGIFG